MKKNFKKTIMTVLLAFSMVFMSACSWFDKVEDKIELPTIQDYSFVQNDTVYQRTDVFTLDGTSLVLQMSDGTSVTINLANSMLKFIPDMTTAGLKTIVIVYEGNEYSFNINVLPAEIDTHVYRLQQLLAAYNAGDLDVSSINASANFDLFYKFLQDEAAHEGSQEFNLTTAQIMDILSGTGNDTLTDMYKIMLDAFIKSSLNSQFASVLSDDNLTAGYSIGNYLMLTAMNMSDADFKAYAIKNIIKENKNHIESFLESVANVIPLLEPSEYSELKSILMDHLYYDVIYSQEIDMIGMIEEIQEVFENNTTLADMERELLGSILESAKSDPAHALSNLLNDILPYGHLTYLDENENTQFIKLDEETTQESQMKLDLIEASVAIIRVIEDIYTVDFKTTLNNLEIALMNFEEKQDVLQDLGYYFFADYYEVEIAYSVIDDVRFALEQDWLALDNKYMATYTMQEVVFSYIAEVYVYAANVDESEKEIIYNEIKDYLFASFEDLESFEIQAFLDGLKEVMPSIETSTFIQNFEEYGTPKLLTTLLIEDLERSKSYADPIEDAEIIALWDELAELIVAVFEPFDNMFVYNHTTQVWSYNPIDLQQLQIDLHAATVFYVENSENELVSENEIVVEIFAMISNLINPAQLFEENFKDVVFDYKDLVGYYMTNLIGLGLGFEYSEDTFDAIYDWTQEYIVAYTYNQLNIEEALTDFFEIVEQYGSEETKAITYSLAALYAFTQDNFDYNALLQNVELPAQIEDIDFNLLIAKIKSESTYSNIMNISNIVVETVMDENGDLQKEIITLTLNIDFDVMISEILGEFNIVIELNY